MYKYNSLLSCNMTYSQVLGFKTWTSTEDHSAYHPLHPSHCLMQPLHQHTLSCFIFHHSIYYYLRYYYRFICLFIPFWNASQSIIRQTLCLVHCCIESHAKYIMVLNKYSLNKSFVIEDCQFDLDGIFHLSIPFYSYYYLCCFSSFSVFLGEISLF